MAYSCDRSEHGWRYGGENSISAVLHWVDKRGGAQRSSILEPASRINLSAVLYEDA
jgi:hypothetical protein